MWVPGDRVSGFAQDWLPLPADPCPGSQGSTATCVKGHVGVDVGELPELSGMLRVSKGGLLLDFAAPNSDSAFWLGEGPVPDMVHSDVSSP